MSINVSAEEMHFKGQVILNNSTKKFSRVIKGNIPAHFSLVSDDESLIVEIKNTIQAKDYHLKGEIYKYDNQEKGELVNHFEVIHLKNKEAIFEVMDTDGDLTEFSILRL
jgi:hypothetical protein